MNIVKKTFMIVLIASVVFTMLPQLSSATVGTITADGTYNLSDYGNDSDITIDPGMTVTVIGDAATTYTNVKIVCGAGVSLTLNNVKIDNSAVSGRCALSFTSIDNTLTLAGESTLISGENQPGVKVESGAALTIEGGDTDKLTATGGVGGAGIGGAINFDGGNITINSGRVTATASGINGGAGIGGGYGGRGGTVIVNGGMVEATGSYEGAGIGGAGANSIVDSGNGGAFTMNGGTVTATGGRRGAGIGGGYRSKGGVITINDGTVTANGNYGAGIGGGYGGSTVNSGEYGNGGIITIRGGTVTAKGINNGAGIGGGYGGDGGVITISGGKVTAIGGQQGGAGIGGGYGIVAGGGGSGGIINISGGEVTASSGNTTYSLGAGIGGGQYKDGGTITISGGRVTATGGQQGGAGIGGGGGSGSDDGGSGGDITISGGTVTASGVQNSAGIGGGGSYSTTGSYVAGNGGEITISGGTITATGGVNAAGIGGGFSVTTGGGSGGNITISGGTVTATGGDGGAGIGGGKSTGSSGAVGGSGGIITLSGSIGSTVIFGGGTSIVSGGTLTATGSGGGADIGGGAGATDQGTLKVQMATNLSFTAEQTGGTDGTADSTGIILTFSEEVTGLTADKITIIDGTGSVIKGILSGSGTTWTIHLDDVITQGNVIVFVADFGNRNVTTVPQSVAVYKFEGAYSVTYNANGGEGSVPPKVKKLPEATFEVAEITLIPPLNKIFKEWNTAADASGTAYAPGETVTMPAHDLTLYAIWRSYTPSECIDYDFDTLVWDVIKGGNSVENDVRTSLILPTTLANGSTVAWSTSDTDVINAESGNITRQLYDDRAVALTATVSYPGAATKTKTFNLTVPEIQARFEAEADDATRNAVQIYANASAPGASGAKMIVNMNVAGSSYVQWDNLPKSDMIGIRYASINTGTTSIYKNGVHVMDAEFTSTGGWSGVGYWAIVWVPLKINSGDSLKIQYDDGDAILNLDCIDCYAGSLKIEAENTTHNAKAYSGDQAVGASGGMLVGSINSAGKYVQFDSLPKSSMLEIRYSTVNNGKISIYKNGVNTTDISFASTGAWYGEGRFDSLWVPLEINNGDSLKIQYDAGDAALNLDYIECYASLIEDAVLNPASLTFDKTKPEDITTTVEWNDARSIVGIKASGVFIDTSNYSVTGDTLTIRKEYLVTKAVGDLVLTVVFKKGNSAILTITVSESPIVSVDVTWGSMEFTYADGAWNPNIHEYEGGGWTASENANKISITSTSEIPVTVSYHYAQEAEFAAVSGGFTDGTNPITSRSLPPGNTEPQSCEAFLILSGQPPEVYISKIGLVTVTITD